MWPMLCEQSSPQCVNVQGRCGERVEVSGSLRRMSNAPSAQRGEFFAGKMGTLTKAQRQDGLARWGQTSGGSGGLCAGLVLLRVPAGAEQEQGRFLWGRGSECRATVCALPDAGWGGAQVTRVAALCMLWEAVLRRHLQVRPPASPPPADLRSPVRGAAASGPDPGDQGCDRPLLRAEPRPGRPR